MICLFVDHVDGINESATTCCGLADGTGGVAGCASVCGCGGVTCPAGAAAPPLTRKVAALMVAVYCLPVVLLNQSN